MQRWVHNCISDWYLLVVSRCWMHWMIEQRRFGFNSCCQVDSRRQLCIFVKSQCICRMEGLHKSSSTSKDVCLDWACNFTVPFSRHTLFSTLASILPPTLSRHDGAKRGSRSEASATNPQSYVHRIPCDYKKSRQGTRNTRRWSSCFGGEHKIPQDFCIGLKSIKLSMYAGQSRPWSAKIIPQIPTQRHLLSRNRVE